MISTLILLLAMVVPVGNISTFKDTVAVAQNADYCRSFSLNNLPEAQSMLGGETRKWYNDRLAEIPQTLKSEKYNNLSERDKAITASNLRNCYKHTARAAMKCATCANYLNANENPLSFEELEEKYNKNYTKIIEKSYKSRESVNVLSKISDFFEAHTPWLYEKVFFPIGMKLSRIFR